MAQPSAKRELRRFISGDSSWTRSALRAPSWNLPLMNEALLAPRARCDDDKLSALSYTTCGCRQPERSVTSDNLSSTPRDSSPCGVNCFLQHESSVRTRANVSARPRANTRGRAAVSLRYNCNFCALTGTFPDAFTPAKVPRLQQAYWDGNGFSGTLPGSIGSLPSLTVRPTFDQHSV